jgi:hypothetical protein
MSIFNNLNNLTLFGWEFKKNSKTEKDPAPFIDKTDESAAHVIGSSGWGYSTYQLNLDQSFKDDNAMIERYREISVHPEMDSAITEIVNEAISGEINDYPVSIILDDIELSDSIKDKILDEFEKILKLMDFNNEAYEIFRKWFVDGKLYYYMVKSTNPKDGLIEVRYVSPLQIKKIRDEKRTADKGGIHTVSKVEEYYVYTPRIYKDMGTAIKLSLDSVACVTSGIYDESTNKTFSYLHKALKPLNQLRMLEDATIIYRLSRAPERRVFYIDVGQMPKNKAEEYIRNIMAKFKNKMVYDAVTGEVKDQKNTLSMMEDFWLPRQEGGRGTEVSTLQGGQNLGQIEDLEYFKRKLLMSLYVPYGRLAADQQSMFNLGRSSEISREELKFSKFVSRLRKKFSKIFLDILKTQLLLKQIITEADWEFLEEQIRFDFVTDNFFKELKESEILRERLSLLQEVEPYVGTYYSKEYVRRNVLEMNDEDIKEMKKEIEKEKKEEEALPEEDQEEDKEEPVFKSTPKDEED